MKLESGPWMRIFMGAAQLSALLRAASIDVCRPPVSVGRHGMGSISSSNVARSRPRITRISHKSWMRRSLEVWSMDESMERAERSAGAEEISRECGAAACLCDFLSRSFSPSPSRALSHSLTLSFDSIQPRVFYL